MIWQKINYIHANPVKAKLVASAKDYRWSSFRAFINGAVSPLPSILNGGGPMIRKLPGSERVGLRSYEKRD